jgi:hypothetical protein
LAHKSYIPKTHYNPMFTIGWEKHLLQKNFNFLDIKTDNTGLTCFGSVNPSEYSISYTYKVRFSIGKKPKVFAVSPKIEYQEDIHMYPNDNSLCLYYPGDFSWTSSSHLYDTIIPWTHEWFLFYELYQIYGIWMHPAVSHNGIKKD